jgi:hypothetical protein
MPRVRVSTVNTFEELPLGVDQRDRRVRYFEDLGGKPCKTVEALVRRGVYQAGFVERGQSGRVA